MTTSQLSRAVTGDLLNFFQSFNYATTLSNLILLTERDFAIDKGENSVIRGRECFSVRVARANRPMVNLHFDKASSLLFKADYQARFVDPKMTLQPNATLVELYFNNYQMKDGISQWRRMEQWRDGKRFSEWTLTEVRFFDKADDALFLSEGLDDAAQRAMTEYRQGHRQPRPGSNSADNRFRFDASGSWPESKRPNAALDGARRGAGLCRVVAARSGGRGASIRPAGREHAAAQR